MSLWCSVLIGCWSWAASERQHKEISQSEEPVGHNRWVCISVSVHQSGLLGCFCVINVGYIDCNVVLMSYYKWFPNNILQEEDDARWMQMSQKLSRYPAFLTGRERWSSALLIVRLVREEHDGGGQDMGSVQHGGQEHAGQNGDETWTRGWNQRSHQLDLDTHTNINNQYILP